MKKLFLIFCMLPMSSFAASVSAKVGYIVDGDTFSALVYLGGGASVSVRVRILNIDAPEIHGDCDSEITAAARAKARLEELLPVGNIVRLSEIKDDKYLGRIDALVETADGRDVGAVMLKEKLARKYGGGKRKSWCD